MEVSVNWWGIILAAFSTMVVGSIWYTPKVFGDSWMKLIGKKPKDLEQGGTARPILITLAVSFISAYVLAHVSFLSHEFFKNTWFQDAISTAFWVWLGFTAARFVTHDVFERRPWKLTIMNSGYELVAFLVMGAVIGWIHP